MCSYNRLNGTFACGNKDTLTKILRDEMGFKGFVTSDWGAVHSVDFINAGLDMEMPGEPDPKSGGFSIPSFFDSRPVPPPPPPHATEDMADMFGGHIPEEPVPPQENFGNWGVKLDQKKMPAALKDGTVTEAAVTRVSGRPVEARRNAAVDRGECQDHREDRRGRGGTAEERGQHPAIEVVGSRFGRSDWTDGRPGRLHRHQRRALGGLA
jgi:hypothetical protein